MAANIQERIDPLEQRLSALKAQKQRAEGSVIAQRRGRHIEIRLFHQRTVMVSILSAPGGAISQPTGRTATVAQR